MSSVIAHFGKRKSQGGDCKRSGQYYLDFFVRNVSLLRIIISLLPEETIKLFPIFKQ